MSEDEEEEDDDPSKKGANYIPTPQRSRFTRRIKITEEMDEDEQKSQDDRSSSE